MYFCSTNVSKIPQPRELAKYFPGPEGALGSVPGLDLHRRIEIDHVLASRRIVETEIIVPIGLSEDDARGAFEA